MQLTPATAARFKVEICDPADNVLGGVRYLRHLHARFRNPFYILAAYHARRTGADRRQRLPTTPETLAYIARVMDDFYDWPTIADGTRCPPRLKLPHPVIGPRSNARNGSGVDGFGFPPRDRQRARGGSPSAEPGPVDWEERIRGEFRLTERSSPWQNTGLKTVAFGHPRAVRAHRVACERLRPAAPAGAEHLAAAGPDPHRPIATSLAILAVIAAGFLAFVGLSPGSSRARSSSAFVLVFGSGPDLLLLPVRRRGGGGG